MKVIIAARLSKVQKDGRPGIGLDTQDKRSREWAEREGHEVITDPIADTKSGTVAPWDRKNLKPWVTRPELMEAYDGIVAFKNDRLSRGCWADEARIRLWAEEHGKALLIVDGPQWPPRHDGDKWSWEAQADQAFKEWEAGRERSMRAQGELRERGMLVGRYPWGYASEGEKYNRVMVTTAEGEQYVPQVFTRVADGGDDGKLPAVAAWLSEQTGRTWHARTISAMIRNPAYRGEYCARKPGKGPVRYGRLIHKCPPLVDGDLWRRANASLDGRPSSRRGQRTDLAAGAAMQSGLAWCGDPGCTAGPDSPMCKSGKYYRCTGRGARRKGCGNMVPIDAADALMNHAMGGMLRPVLRPVFHAATGHQIELDDVTQALEDLAKQGLDRRAEQAERERLWAEQDRLAALPAKAAWTEYVPVLDEAGEPLTYGAKWAASDQAERRAWLRDAGFAAYLGKPGTAVAGDEDADEYEALSRVDAWENDRAQLVFRWTGDDDAGLARGLPGLDEAS